MRPALCERPQNFSAERFWEAMVHAGIVMDCPFAWSDRYLLWLAGGAFRIDRRSLPVQSEVTPKGLRLPCPSPDSVAVMGEVFGELWAYSHRAVFQAATVWKTWNVGQVWGLPLWATWLNGIPNWSGADVYYPCPSPFEGYWAATNGETRLLWHPQLLGPCWKIGKSGVYESAPGLVWEGGERCRGEQVPSGILRSGMLEPVVHSQGWFPLGLTYENRRL